MTAIARNRLLNSLLFQNRSRATRVIRQTGNAYCLDAVIQMLCAHYELPIPAGSEIRRLAGTTANGASMLGAKNCLEQIGFFANAGRCSFKELGRLTAPAIAVVTNKDGSLHYVIINRARFGMIEILNPAGGTRTRYNRKQFETVWTGILLLASPKPGESVELAVEDSPLGFLADLMSRQRGSVLLASVSGVLQVALVIAGLLFIREFITGINYSASNAELIGSLIGFLLCAVFKVMFCDCYDRIKSGMQKRVTLGLELQATEHVQRMTSESLSRADSLELAQRSRSDAAKIGKSCAALTDILVQALIVGLLLATIGWINSAGNVWAVAVGISLLLPLLSYWPSRKAVRLEREAGEAGDLVRKTLAESIAGAGPLRRSGATNQRVNETRRLQLDSFRATEKLQQHRTHMQTSGLMLAGLIATAVLAVSWLTSPEDPGLIISYFILVNMMTFALRKFSINIAQIPDFVHTIRRYLDLLSEQQERSAFAADNGLTLQCKRLRFEKVDLQSTRLGSTGLVNFSFELKQRESAMICDESGQYTEALAKLLTGQVETESGRILLDSINVQDLESEQFRRLIGFTSGNPYVFQVSLRNNISPGSSSVSINDLNRVVARAGLQDLVDKLPKRFETVVGRKGMFTTWDERYRIGLARMLMADPRIIVLELPKYQLPDSLCQVINHLIQTRWRNRIVLILSSRPQPIIRCTNSYRFNRLGQFSTVN